MLPSLIIVFREVLEAGLIVGIVLAATRSVAGRLGWIVGGIAGGVAGAMMVAALAGTISSALEGMGQEVFNASILLIAVVMLGWHNIWMAAHGREMGRAASTLGRAVASGDKSLMALAIVVAVAVLREGSEVVLFLYGIAATGTDSPGSMLVGGIAGVGAGCLVSLLMYRGMLAIPIRHFFTVTQTMIALLAAGMAGQAAALLASDDLIPTLGDKVWDTSWLLPEKGDSALGWLGRALHALVGYADKPTGVQVLAWIVTLTLLFVLARVVSQSAERSATLQRA